MSFKCVQNALRVSIPSNRQPNKQSGQRPATRVARLLQRNSDKTNPLGKTCFKSDSDSDSEDKHKKAACVPSCGLNTYCNPETQDLIRLHLHVLSAWLRRNVETCVLAPRFDPTTVPDRELPVAPSAGLATAGFRSAKYSPREWQENNSATLQRALTDQQHAQRVLRASRALSAEAAAGTQDAQSRGTLLLGARLQDVHSRRTELQRGAERLQAETELLQDHKRRLEKALLTTDLPLTISTDNLTCRENRFGPDLVQDPVEEELLKV
uniref:Tektin n=1 Tax=Astyanax mexicanus TaxID=7994 RepID=A0A8B9HT22_ASTMX